MSIAAPSFAIRVNEKSTFSYTATLRDENGVILGPTDLTGLTFTLFDQDSNAIINGRSNQNILNANDWTLSSASSSNLSWVSVANDCPIIDDSKETEVHIGLITWTYGTSKSGNKCIAIRVVNIVRVT